MALFFQCLISWIHQSRLLGTIVLNVIKYVYCFLIHIQHVSITLLNYVLHKILSNTTMVLNQKVFNYSLKNCPIPHQESYLKCLIHKTESFLRRIRWRAFFHLLEKDNDQSSDEDDDSPTTKHYGFPSPNCPPYVPELAGFESDLWSLVNSVSFTEDRNKFQKCY